MAGETPQMKLVRESAEKRTNSTAEITEGGWPFCDGLPMVKITAAAAELVPTQQYGNATIGPVQVTCFASHDGRLLIEEEGLAQAIRTMQSLCEAATAEDRQTVHSLIRGRAGK